MAARAGALGSMLLYVNARVSGDPLVLLGQTFPTEATFSVFLLWGGMAMGFAALAIIVSYRADVIIFDVAQSYVEMVVRRVLHYKAAGRKIELPDDLEEYSSEAHGTDAQGKHVSFGTCRHPNIKYFIAVDHSGCGNGCVVPHQLVADGIPYSNYWTIFAGARLFKSWGDA